MGPFPIFLVKRELDSKYLNKIGDLTSGYADTTHWALEVRGIHYHLGTGKSMKSSSSNYGVKGLSLDKSNLSQRLIPWYLLGVSNKGHHVGDTHMSDWEIEQTGMYSFYDEVHRATVDPNQERILTSHYWVGYAILSEWKSRNIKYNLLQWNCQHFVGFLLARISLTIPKMLVSWFAMPIEVLVPQLESSIVSPGDLNFITLLYWVYYYPYQFSVLRDLPWQSKAVQSILESLLG